jgi:hypothetical protein
MYNIKRIMMLWLSLFAGLALTWMLSYSEVTARAQDIVYRRKTETMLVGTIDKVSMKQTFTPTWAIERVDAEKTFMGMTDRSLVLDSAGHPHIAYGRDHLYYAWHDGSMWHSETVDPAWGVGRYASIDLDSNHNPHISYYDDFNGDLKYTYYDGSRWHISKVDVNGDVGRSTSIALDMNDHPHIGYNDATNDSLKYARHDGMTWHIETIDTHVWIYRHLSLALDSAGRPHIGYAWTVGPNDELRYARWTGSTWITETVDSGDSVGQYTSLALDSSDRPHISYLDGSNEVLMYAHWTGSTWSTETVASSVGWATIDTSIALDTSDDPYIAYTNSTNGYLTYASWTGSAWSIEPVDTSDWMWSASLAFDSSDHPRISYVGRSSDDLHYARWTGSAWDIQTADSGADIGAYTSLVLAPTTPYTPHISYAGGSLRYARYDGTTWVTETIDSTDVWGGTSLALVPTAPYDPRIAYYDIANDVLKYARWTGGGWNLEIIDSVKDSPWGVSLALEPTVPYTPHIAYVGVGGNLKYARWMGDTWNIEMIDYATDGFFTLASPSLALAPTAPYTPLVSYHDADWGNVRFAWLTESGWVTGTVAYARGGSADTSLAVDSLGNPHIAYDSNTGLQYARWTGNDWAIERADQSGSPSLALDENDNPHIGYYTGWSGGQNLNYAYLDGSMWVTETVDNLGDVGQHASLALDEDDHARIAYYDKSNGDLKLAWGERVDVIPTTGGTLGAYGSATFDFPSGVFTDTVVFTYTVLQPSVSQPNVGVFFDITAVFAGNGDAAQVAPGQTYTVVVYYDEANIPPNVDEADLALYYWNEGNSRWVKEPTSTVNTVDNTITATPNHFSVWAGLFEIATGIQKQVIPQGQVDYGDQLTYTLVISASPGTQLSLYDPMTETTCLHFVEPLTGIECVDNVITGTLEVTPTNQVTVSFVVQVGVPGTVGWTMDVSNRACVYPAGGTVEEDCTWSRPVTNEAFHPYDIFLPLVLRNLGASPTY